MHLSLLKDVNIRYSKVINYGRLQNTINEPNDINLLIRQNEFISPEKPDLRWSRNSVSVQTGEISSSTVKQD